uniref:uncharacterized protein LOC120345343 isoform X2 n=1 Tax=Styela clava TaxID=7725 RepID=UPI001939F438|nr:uncharacterized protein LOC120345343 isoform X2 [Styela clava]
MIMGQDWSTMIRILMFLSFTVGLASGNKIYHFNPPSPSTPYYYPGTKVPVHPPPYDKNLFKKKGFLNVPLTMALCRKYSELRRLKPCARAIQNMQRRILPSCPLSDNNRWPSNTSQHPHTRTKRSLTPLPECTSSQPNPITVVEARDSFNPNKTWTLYQCIPQDIIQVYYTNCDNNSDFGWAGLSCNALCVRMNLLVYANDDLNNDDYITKTVDVDLSCCLTVNRISWK